jgi:pimeloyl-[acyl-carrier protein] synthase
VTVVRDLDELLVSEEFVRDPYPTLAVLRDTDPVYWSDSLGGWILTRYDDILATFKDVAAYSNEGRLGRASAYLPAEARGRLEVFAAHYRTKGLLHSDPPDHTRLRRLVLRAFSPRVVEAMRPRIQQIVDGLIDRVADAGAMDAVEDLAFALPLTVLAELLGVDATMGPRFRGWADRLLAFQGQNRPAEHLLLAAQDALLEARQYLADLIARRRREPGTDLISLMACPGDGVEALSDAEIINTGITLLTAGHETTASLIGNGLYTLLSHPEQWARLKADPALLGPAIEEILRFESPVARQPRLLRRDTELRGRRLRAGQMAFQMLGAANRDPAQFRAPDSFDVGRDPNRHIAFGQGIHFCIGAPLSRAEGQITFRALLDRLPEIRLAGPAPDWDVTKPNSRVLRSLPVAF